MKGQFHEILIGILTTVMAVYTAAYTIPGIRQATENLGTMEQGLLNLSILAIVFSVVSLALRTPIAR